VAVIDFAQTIAPNDFHLVGRGDDRCRFHRSTKRGRVDRTYRLATKAFRQSLGLISSFIRQLNIGGAGETILGTQDRRPMANQEKARVHPTENSGSEEK
jgi:hypothetical protein